MMSNIDLKFKCKLYINGGDSNYCSREKKECTFDIGNSFCTNGYLTFDWIDYVKWGYKYAKK